MNDKAHRRQQNDDAERPYGRTMTRPVSMHTLVGFNELRLNKKLCDASLILDNGDAIPIHRSVLSGPSDYFRILFNNTPHEDGCTRIPMKGINSSTMELILQYIYVRQMEIDCNNVLEVMRVADFLCIDGLVQLCHVFVVECLAAENCVNLLLFADHYNFGQLRDESYRYIVKNFVTIAENCDVLMDLGHDELKQIIGHEQLNAKYEEDVWEIVVKWIERDPENREGGLESLLPKIRFGLMDFEYFTYSVREHRYVRDRAYFRRYVLETSRCRHATASGAVPSLSSSMIARPRYPAEVLFAVGGWSDGNPTAAVETYDRNSDCWTRVFDEDPYGPRAYHGTVVVGHYIYVVGGFDGSDYFNSCRMFDTVTKTWEEVAPMNCKRCYVSVVLMDGVIYAMGGSDGHRRLCSAEKYDLQRNQWTMIAPMTYQRSDACAAVFNNKLYMVGGFDGRESTDTVETYDAKANKWTPSAPMSARRSGLSCATYHDRLYVLGGFDGQRRMCCGERFDPTANSWSPVPDMTTPRSNFAAHVLDDMIFVAGGFDGTTTIARVEYYNDNTNKWFDANNMHVRRSALSTCVVRDLPDMDYYMPLDGDRLCHEVRSRIDQRNRAGDAEDDYTVPDDDNERDGLPRNEITYDDMAYGDGDEEDAAEP